jgi:type II secretory pathway pseudopilin PulG
VEPVSGTKPFLAEQRGFSLIAVLVAVVLVAVAVVALSGTIVYVLSMQSESTIRSTAAGIAAAYMEEVKARPVASLASEAAVAVDNTGRTTSGVGEQAFLRELTVDAGPVPKSKLVKISVQYPRGSTRMGHIDLVTIIYEGVG